MGLLEKIVREKQQPNQGYFPIYDFNRVLFDMDMECHPDYNLKLELVEVVVLGMMKYLTGSALADAFNSALRGAELLDSYGHTTSHSNAVSMLLSEIHGIDDESIRKACKLGEYIMCCEKSISFYEPVLPDEDTIDNIRILTLRGVVMLLKNGGVMSCGLDFTGGYTDSVPYGEADFITPSMLCIMTCGEVTIETTLRLVISYIMGTHSVHSEFSAVTSLGILSLSENALYTLPLDSIVPGVMNIVSSEVIGY